MVEHMGCIALTDRHIQSGDIYLDFEHGGYKVELLTAIKGMGSADYKNHFYGAYFQQVVVYQDTFFSGPMKQVYEANKVNKEQANYYGYIAVNLDGLWALFKLIDVFQSGPVGSYTGYEVIHHFNEFKPLDLTELEAKYDLLEWPRVSRYPE